MFHLYHHHDLERLAELLAVLLERDRPASPLVPEKVVVPNQGVTRWLQGRLAEDAGIAANIDFLLPAAFIWKDLCAAEPELPDADDYSRDRLVWHLYRLLPELARQEPAIGRFLAAKPAELQRIQLAERLADVFDQYQVFRGRMLLAWQDGRVDTTTATARWQAQVWQALTETLGRDHRVAVLRALIGRLQATDRVEGQRVFLFGTGDLPPDYLRVFYALGRSRDVHLLLPNPSEAYWGDLRERRLSITLPLEEDPDDQEAAVIGHPLLAAMGRPARDFIRLLYSQELTGILEPELGEAMAYAPPGEETLLRRVQSGVIRLDAAADGRGLDGDDVSLQVHVCHGPLREVQVLHDQLLDLLARDPDLQPRDIVVMIPDLPAYAPAVHSVFGAAEGRRHIPFSISDQPRRAAHPVVQTFRDLLDLPLSRWTVSHILEIASVPAVMRRFRLDAADLENLRHWVAEAGVRWGLDAETRRRMGAGGVDLNTWIFGLDRLLLGSVLADDDALIDDTAPWTDLEGGGTGALGGLHCLLRLLARWQSTLERDHPPADWRRRLNDVLEALFQVDADDRGERDALEAIHGALGFLDTADRCLGEEPLSWLALRECLRRQLDAAGERQPFLSGGVTVCGMQSLAGVPFRVVCLLGMNDGDFPRQDGGREFNLILQQRYPGDRSNRDTDRLAFLQALLAARDVFYLSYTGVDVRNGERLEPSTTVGEFLDFLRLHAFSGWSPEAVEKRLISHQPMQPFGRAYFEPERSPRIFTFDDAWRAGSVAQAAERNRRPGLVDGSQREPETDTVIELDRLRRFFRDPARDFLEQRLDLQLDVAASLDSEDEPLALAGLDAWRLRAALLEAVEWETGPALPERPPRLWQRRGVLPPPPLDTTAWQAEVRSLEPLLEIRRHWEAVAPQPREIDVRLPDGTCLTGRIGDARASGLRRLRAGSLAARHVLGDWIDYLALLAAGGGGELELAGVSRGQVQHQRAAAESNEAVATLAALVAWYRAGSREPLVFLPDLAVEYLEARDKALEKASSEEEAAATALETVNRSLSPDAYHRHPARGDPWFMAVLDPVHRLGQAPEQSLFPEMAEAVCGLLHRRLANVGDGA